MASKSNQYNGGSKSIIDNRRQCHWCGKCSGLELHHCMHGSNRKNATEDGLVVFLCHECHWEVHNSKEGHHMDEELQKEAERAYLETHTLKEWRERYTKNLL